MGVLPGIGMLLSRGGGAYENMSAHVHRNVDIVDLGEFQSFMQGPHAHCAGFAVSLATNVSRQSRMSNMSEQKKSGQGMCLIRFFPGRCSTAATVTLTCFYSSLSFRNFSISR